jgi:hypothetical protein
LLETGGFYNPLSKKNKKSRKQDCSIFQHQIQTKTPAILIKKSMVSSKNLMLEKSIATVLHFDNRAF